MKYTYDNQFQRSFGSILAGTVGGFATGGPAGAVAGGAMAIGQQIAQDEQQKRTKDLMNTQVNNQEALMRDNMNMQEQYWHDTNYSAQVDEAKKAGLNPALLYAKGGGGGSTMPGGPSAGMGIAPQAENKAQQLQTAGQAAEIAADVRLKNAQADNLSAQTPQQADLMNAQIASINQGVNNQKAQEILTDLQAQTQRITNTVASGTIDDQIAQMQAASSKMQQDAQIATRNNYIDQNTMDDRMKTIQGIMIGQFIKNNLDKSEIGVNNQQINESINRIAQQWKSLNINQQNANTQESQMKIQQMIHDIPDSKHILYQGLTRLIPNIIW
jgi:hypothetical protein